MIDRYDYLNKKDKNVKEWMEFVVMLNALQGGHYFYVEQIKNYEWVDTGMINESVNRIINVVTKGGQFNHEISKSNLKGCIDYKSDDIFWLFKCAMTLTDEYYIQIATHIALYGGLLNGKLYNCRTNELVEITIDDPKKFLSILMRNHN